MVQNAYGGAGQADVQNTKWGYTNSFSAKNDAFTMSSPLNRGMFFLSGQRRRLNIVAVLLSLFVPWLLFCSVYFLLSSQVHYKYPSWCYFLVFVAFVCFVCSSAYFALSAMKKRFLEPSYQPSWYVFIAVTSALAFILAVAAGHWNFIGYMEPYYNLESLASYKDISTNDFVGQQLMDAGTIDFQKGTVLDLGRSMGFKNHDIYCVAPIVTGGSAKTAGAMSVDFWAVGKNCCSGVSADFHCSGFSDPKNTGVIRMMNDEERPFYRLAVQQAEATYKITASHPLFFQWVRNAEEATENFAYRGHFNYFVGIAAHFLMQIFLTATAALAFAKLIHA